LKFERAWTLVHPHRSEGLKAKNCSGTLVSSIPKLEGCINEWDLVAIKIENHAITRHLVIKIGTLSPGTSSKFNMCGSGFLAIRGFNLPPNASSTILFFCRRPLPFGGSHLRLPSGPAGIRTMLLQPSNCEHEISDTFQVEVPNLL